MTSRIVRTSNTSSSRKSRCGYDIKRFSVSTLTAADVLGVRKTTRTGSFRASELAAALYWTSSAIVFSHRRFGRSQTAILLYAPEMDGNEHHRQQRKNHAMENVEAQQRVLAHQVPAQKKKSRLTAEKRHGRDDVGTHRNCPKSQ